MTFESWRQSLQPKIEDDPERDVIPSLIPARESGLTTIVQLLYSGYFGERINREHLVVSAETRHDAQLFSRALKAKIL